MNRKIAERYQRKKAILNGALKSYSKYGIDGMTMDNIASDSDFGKATIYYFFPSKEEGCEARHISPQSLLRS